MFRAMSLIGVFVAALSFAQCGNAQLVNLSMPLLLSHSPDEAVELLVGVRLQPPGLAPLTTDVVTYSLELVSDEDPYSVNVAQVESPANGFGVFNIHVEDANGCTSLIVNEQNLGCVAANGNGRFAYQVAVAASGDDARFLAGGEFPIPVVQSVFATATLVAPDGGTTAMVEVSVFNRFVFDGDVNPS